MKKSIAYLICVLFLLTPLSALAAEEETVYATETVNIRTEPSTNSNIVAILQKGDPITRLDETTDGWSKVLYYGEECYVTSKYLSAAASEDKSGEDADEYISENEVTEDNSTPRFMVTGYELSEDSISPEKTAELRVTFKNYSTTKAIYNIKFSLEDPSDEILTTGMPTEYVKSISADGMCTWKIELTATKGAAIGQHDLQVSAEYEDKNYNSYSSSDTVRVDVRQSVKLKYSGAFLPKKVTQGDVQSVSVDLMNTGKSTIYNCVIDFDIKHLQSGGSVFVGNIEASQSGTGTANLRVDSDALGKAAGKITITYEDDYGKEYKKRVKVSTMIEEKIEAVSLNEEKKEKKNPLWWLFILIGLIVGGGAGFGVMWYINDKKQRKEDDLRL